MRSLSLIVLVTFVVSLGLLAESVSVAGAKKRHQQQVLAKELSAKLHKSRSILRSSLPVIKNNWNFLDPRLEGVNGAGTCAGCTLIVGLLEQLAQIHNSSVDHEMESLCNKIGGSFGKACASFFATFGPAIIKLIEDEATADEVCHVITLCKVEDGQYCRLFPKPHLKAAKAGLEGRPSSVEFPERLAWLAPRVSSLIPDVRSFNICSIIPEVCLVEDHLPFSDADGDWFSTYDTLRGTYWRGKDCNDNDATIHPGRDSDDAEIDNNCNGVYGTDVDGIPYETKWCNGTDSMGIAILGDSATAHFRIPPGWLTASKMSLEDYSGVIRDAEDELDWPMLSWSTGHLNTSQFAPDISGPVDSMYLRLKKRNLCNNNDYQNMGVNGARSTNLLHFAQLLGRTNSDNGNGGEVPEKPLFLIMAMIGNDVCGSHHGFDRMTSADVYRESVKAAVLYADSVLAPGSKIVLVGLADGRVLWDAMHNRIHPIGETNQDVTYKDLYGFLNCLHISPCWGWMNDNATVRNLTSAHAALLSSQLYTVQNETAGSLKNSEVMVITDWIKAIREAPYPHWMLIEPVDGFHPSQLGNFLIADYIFNQTRDAGFIPAENPNNAAIKAQFPGI